MKTKDTKEKILSAGLRLISSKGYMGTTTKEIAKEAGISEVTLFRHFPAKETLFECIIRNFSFLPTIKLLLPELSKMPYEDALKSVASKFLERLLERKDMIRIMHTEFHLYPQEVREMHHNMMDEMTTLLASYFKEQQATGILREFDARLAARGFMGMFFSYFTTRELHKMGDIRRLDPQTVINEYVGIFVRGTVK